MEKLSKELEQKVIELLQEKKTIEAVSLVQKELQLGLRNSKDIVDHYLEKIKKA